jgi:hypothetical protein
VDNQHALNQKIRERAKAFNMDDDTEAMDVITAMSGYSEQSTEAISDDANGNMSLSEALSAVQFRESHLWKTVLDGWNNLASDLQKTAENVKLSRDERSAAFDKLQGVKDCQAYFGSVFAEAASRVATLSTDDKVALGPEGVRVIDESKRQELPSSFAQQDQTRSAVAFLEGKK